MIHLKDIKQEIENNQINFYKVNLPVNIITDGIQFLNIDDFINFLLNQNVTAVFGCEHYDNIDDCLITESVIEKTIGSYLAEKLQDIIINDINKYNKDVLKYDLNEPSLILICCIYEGKYCFLCIENNNQESLPDPSEKLQEIINKNRITIQKNEEQQEKILDKLKIELKKMIKNDEKFLLCTNKRLRELYIKDLLKNELDNHFEPIKRHWTSDAPRGIYQGAVDFVELIWKEIQKQ